MSKKFYLPKIMFRLMAAFAALLLAAGSVCAQNIKVTGKVTDQNGEPVIGANVLIQGTKGGAATDVNGHYTIPSCPPAAILEYRCIGYTTTTQAVNGRSVVNVIMAEDATMLQEAVITAEFGLKRVARAVGSAVQNVKATDIQESGRESFVNALQGRVAGITITPTSGAPGASTNVVLRSITSISGSNQPLYVIDGVPMNNSTFDPSSGFADDEAVSARYIDFSSRGNDLNPEDIESMTVLKGGAAAALYGSDASNGAIIITTKKGTAGNGKVSYSNSFSWAEAYGYPKMQTKYANGMYGVTNMYTQNYFGAEYPKGMKLYNNQEAILRTGFTQKHNISVEGGTDKVTVRGSASYLDQNGIVKTTNYNRLNIGLSGKAQVTKWLSFDANLSYAETENTKARKGKEGVLYRATKWPMIDNVADYMDPDGMQMKLPSLYTDTDLLNPLFDLYKNKRYDKGRRFLTSVGVNITPTKHTFATVRMGWDNSNTNYEVGISPYYLNRSNASYGVGNGGSYDLSKQELLDKTLNAIAGYTNTFGKFSVSAQVGYHQQENGVETLSTEGKKFSVNNLFALANCDPATLIARQRHTKRRIQAISMQAEVGYNNMAFLTFRARNDWSSTLPKDNQSFFYPAVEGSFIVTELPFLQGNDIVSYFKVRGAIAEVGKDATPLATSATLQATESIGGGFRFGFSGPNPAIKPEMTDTYEVGFEGRFLNDRINVDFTHFWTKCSDQYVTGFRSSYAAGFVLYNMNVGSFKTHGWELHIDGDVVKSNGIRWNVGANLSHSTSKVTYLPDNLPEYYDSATWICGNIRNGIRVGAPITAITGLAYQRNEKGDVLIDPSTGIPFVDADWSILGDRQPDLELGITTSVSYKGFRLSALFSGKIGAAVVNGTKRDMMGNGTSWESVALREKAGYIFKGVLKNGAENSDHPTPNNIVVDFNNYGSTIYAGGDEDWFEKNVHYIRMQEIRLAYTVPQKWLSNITKKLVSSATIWVAANDLCTWTNYSGIDAVGNGVSASCGGSGGVGFDCWGIPTPRSYSFGINLTF